MKRVVVIGHFDWRGNNMIGAVIKTRNIYEEIGRQLECEQVGFVDIYKWRERTIYVLIDIIKAFSSYTNVVLVCSDTSKLLMKIFTNLKRIFCNRIHYCVVGGNFVDKLKQFPERVRELNAIDYFYVENERCLEEIKSLGIDCAQVMKNFKMITMIQNDCVERKEEQIYRFCTFSRVTREKGISDAIQAIDNLNAEGYLCSLDIYGLIATDFATEFEELICSTNNCTYCGVVDASEVPKIMAKYYALLFPTRFDGEGMPGTIIDAFAASTLIICSRWKYCDEVITDKINGLIYTYKDSQKLKTTMKYAMNHQDVVKKCRKNARKSYQDYCPEVAILPLINNLK